MFQEIFSLLEEIDCIRQEINSGETSKIKEFAIKEEIFKKLVEKYYYHSEEMNEDIQVYFYQEAFRLIYRLYKMNVSK
jgi:DNA polymerase III delta prime subunit